MIVEYFNIYIIIIVGTPEFLLGRFVYAKHLVFFIFERLAYVKR